MRQRSHRMGVGLLMGLALSGPVFAQEGGEPSGFGPLIGILLMLAVFFFLIILPQSRKAKKHAELIRNLEKGDQVIIQGGIHGKIYGLTEQMLTLEVAPQVRIRVNRDSVVSKEETGVQEQSKAAS